MKRGSAMLVVVGWCVSMLCSSASAASLTVRSDPNDTRGPLDIRAVGTDVGRRGALFQIETWERFGGGDGGFFVLLDTNGPSGKDKLIEIVRSGSRYICIAYEANEDMIGKRDATRPDGRSVRCRLPAGWLDIEKTVRFAVHATGQWHDRAPNRRHFRGL